MKHCENCNCIIEEWIKIPELKIEVQKERHSLGKPFNKIIVLKKMRLLTMTEAIWLCNSKYAKELQIETKTSWFEYVEQPFKSNIGKLAAWFGCISNGLYLNGNSNLDSYDAARGVRFARDINV